MSPQNIVLTDVSRVDTVSGGGRPGAPTVRFGLHTTADAPGSGIDRDQSIAVRVTRALLHI
jgi:hypothetical protein